MNNKLSLLFNIALAIGLAVLYILHFNPRNSPPNHSEPIIVPPANAKGISIAYVNIDTLNEKYEWLREQKASLEKRLKNAENALRTKQEALMRDMEAFQNKYQSGTVPPAQLESEYEGLMKRQQKLAEEEQRLAKQLAEEQEKANNEMWSNLETQLKSLQSQIGYDYILAYTKGGGQVLLANDSLEITKQVLDLLNQKN